MSTATDHPLRVVVAEESFLLRAGVVRVLEGTGFVVVGEACDAGSGPAFSSTRSTGFRRQSGRRGRDWSRISPAVR